MPDTLAIHVPFRTRAASFQMDTLDVEKRTVQATVSSGSRVKLPWWMAPARANVDGDFFFEELAIGREHVEGFEFFNSGRAPVLDTHGHTGKGFSVLEQLGHVVHDSVIFVQDSEAPQGVRMDATVEFAEGEEIDKFLRDMKKGVRGHNWSVGFNVLRFADVTTLDDETLVLRAILWEPKEFSPTALGADEGARTRAAGHEGTRCILIPSDRPESRGQLERLVHRSADMDWKTQIRQLVEKAQLDAAFAEKLLAELEGGKHKDDDARISAGRQRVADEIERQRRSGPPPSDPPVDPPADPPADPPVGITQADVDQRVAAALEQQQSQHQALRTAVTKAGLDASFADELIARKLTPLQGHQAILDRLEARSAAGIVDTANPSVTVTQDAWDKAKEGVLNCLEVRVGLRTRDPATGRLAGKVEVSELGRRWRSLSLLEMGREMLRSRGLEVPHTRSKVFEAVMRMRSGGGHGTSDFPELLANVAGKSLRQAYEASPRTWLPLATRNDAPDFKQQARVQLGAGTQLEVVGEHGEFKRGQIGETAEKYTLATYGKIFGFTRQAMINDDTDAFGRLPRQFGRNAAENESDLAWAILTANANMNDGVALFAAGHNNIGTGALSLTSLSAGRTVLRKQTEPDGQRINVIPRYLIVPSELETTAEQLTAARSMLDNTGAPTDLNPFSTLVPIAEPRLSDDSAIKWYLGGDPGQIDILEYAFLEGEGEGPTIETRDGWEIDGMEIKVREDFAIAPLDHRGLFRSTGA